MSLGGEGWKADGHELDSIQSAFRVKAHAHGVASVPAVRWQPIGMSRDQGFLGTVMVDNRSATVAAR